MGSSSWVCFECRQSVRRDTYYREPVPCPECSQSCTWIGYKIPVPPKGKVKVWAALREQLLAERDEWNAKYEQERVRWRHRLEQQIAELESRPENGGRRGQIRHLRRTLKGA